MPIDPLIYRIAAIVVVALIVLILLRSIRVANPAGLELRRMQMITEVGAEQNTMTLIMMPSEFVAAARGLANLAKDTTAK